MPARLGYHRAADPVGGGDVAQPAGGGILAFRVGGWVAGCGNEGGVDCLSEVLRTGRRGDVEPPRHPRVATMPIHDGDRVGSGPSGGVAAEQPGDGLVLGAYIGSAVAGDV